MAIGQSSLKVRHYYPLVQSIALKTIKPKTPKPLSINCPADEVPRQLKVNNCETKWKQAYNPNITGLARPFVGNGKILPPFTSGDLPICHLKSLTRSPIPVILVSKVCLIK